MALTHEILNSHNVAALKKEISKTNIKGYSKMKKNEIVELMMTHKTRFNHIKSAAAAPKKVAEAPKKAKKLTKRELIYELEDNSMKKGIMGSPVSYSDIYVSYRNDYPWFAKTDKQMEKLSNYSSKQLNKQ